MYQQKTPSFHPQISSEWELSILASAHYSKSEQECLNKKNVPFFIRQDNPLNVPQARAIDTVWTLLERKVFENNWEAKNLDMSPRRIKQKSKV